MKKIFFVTFLFGILLFILNTRSQSHAKVKESGEAGKLASQTGMVNKLLSNKEEHGYKDKRVVVLEKYLQQYNSPLAPYAETFIQEADIHNIDWKLVAAIAGLESQFGKRIPKNSYNAWGWGIPTPESKGIYFQSWNHGIQTVSRGLKENYTQKGLITIEQIGKRYAASPT
ncbi:MAG: hypothetical protein N3A54_03525, partial [Patescibacteria group bacterium]|nr:hypothetical protein [Patescibacteria group bacterium]